MLNREVVKAIAVTAKLMGKNFDEEDATYIAGDLASFPPGEVVKALRRCRMELKFFPSMSEIISRIDDGRPGVEESWTMIPKSEADSAIMTDEMFVAWGACSLLMETDMIGARMAFKEVYTSQVVKARENCTSVNWRFSQGHYAPGRKAALIKAVEAKLITHDDARFLIHDYAEKPKLYQPAVTGPVHEFTSTSQMIQEILKKIENKSNEDTAPKTEEADDPVSPLV